MPVYDVDRLTRAADVPLSEPSTIEATGVHHGYRRNRKPVDGRFAWLLEDFQPVKNVWLSHIDPGGYIRPHKDAGPWLERWQIPIYTAGRMTVDNNEILQEPGVPFRVEHWKWHEVVNDTDRPRIHLVVDRDMVVREGSDGFITR